MSYCIAGRQTDENYIGESFKFSNNGKCISVQYQNVIDAYYLVLKN